MQVVIKLGLGWNYDFCNNSRAPEMVCSIHVQNEGNRIEFLYKFYYLISTGLLMGGSRNPIS